MNEERVKELVAQLGDDVDAVRKNAAWTLGIFAENNPMRDLSDAVPALIVALKDDKGSISAAYALGQIGDPSAVDALIVALKDKSQYVRESAAWALGRIGDLSAIPELIVALKDKHRGVGWKATDALVKIGKPAVPALVVALNDEVDAVRTNAAKALGEIGPRNYNDLKLLHSAAREARKEGKDTVILRIIYDKWSKTLKVQADEIVEKKKLKTPSKPNKPDSVKRVQRVKRVVG